MLLGTFIKSLVKDALDAYKLAVLESEKLRKLHYTEQDGVLKHKHTKREHPNGEVHEVPEKTQHNLEDFLVETMDFTTEVDVYSKGYRGNIYTSVKKGLFKNHPNVKIKLTLSRVPSSEGVHAVNDSITEHVKENV